MRTLDGALKSGSPDHGPKRARSRGVWQVIAGLVILIVALALFAWPQGDDEESDGPLNAIAAAAERTRSEPGGRAAMRTVVTSPGEPTLRIRGQMVFDEEERTKQVLTFPDRESGDLNEMEMVNEGLVMYVRSSAFGSLPDGAEWAMFDLASVEDGSDAPLPAEADAMGELELLEEATGGVEKLGKEDVRGVPTTRYRGMAEEEGKTPMQIEAWIDAGGLVRRMRMLQEQPGEGDEAPKTVDMTMDFFDFGATPEIDVPASDEVFDMTDQVIEGADLG